MNGWIPIGDIYVKPVDWDEILVIAPKGVASVELTRQTVTPRGRSHELIGTAPTPAAAARLLER